MSMMGDIAVKVYIEELEKWLEKEFTDKLVNDPEFVYKLLKKLKEDRISAESGWR